MSIFSFNDEGYALGEVRGVDTTKCVVRILSSEKLASTRVGHLITVQGRDVNEWLIGLIEKVWRNPVEPFGEANTEENEISNEENSAQITLLGTYIAKYGEKNNHFTRAILSLPDINRLIFPLEGQTLEQFMNIIGETGEEEYKNALEIGRYSLDRKAKAILDGDKLFQRHAALLGSTGSGKSWTVANILEQADKLNSSNIILFDLHGEYVELPYAQQLRVANASDLSKSDDGILFLPFWLLSFDEIQTLMIDNKDQSAPNQSMAVYEAILELKKQTLEKYDKNDVKERFTVNSPIPFDINDLISILKEKNEQEIETGEFYKSGDKKDQPKTIQGPLHNKLTRLLIRLKNKVEDRRYGFIFQAPEGWNQYDSLYQIANTLLGHKGNDDYNKPGIKIIDFSEIPSDVLPIIISLVARLVYQIQFWSTPDEKTESRQPILLVCDEAHLYLPNSPEHITERRAVEVFERIAKEGRKYGVGLFVVSQRPSDVSTTILSQCNNIISLRLTNDRDKSVVKSLLPDSLGGILDIIPGLEVGECVVVGDSTLLPTRVILNKPKHQPKSSTINFWRRWDYEPSSIDLMQAVENFRKQSRL